jgi:hypothetical protein
VGLQGEADERSAIVKYKARLVAHGFMQREGIDFEEVFALVARMESVLLLLSMAAAKDWIVYHLDVKSAFLNGELAETVFVKQALGFAVKSAEHKVLKLRKALYGAAAGPSSVERQARRHFGQAWVHSLRHIARAVHATTGEGGARCRRVCGRLDRHWSTGGGH